MANIYYGLNVTHSGLTLLHKMKAIDIGSILNYIRVGFGSWIMGHRLAPLMCLGICGSPSLGLGSRWTWSFFSVCWFFWSWLCTVGECNFQDKEGMVSFGFTTLLFVVAYSMIHTSHHCYHDVVVGDRDGKERHGS